MSPHDPPDSFSAAHGDDPDRTGTSPMAGDAVAFNASDPAGAPLAAPDPIEQIASLLAVHGPTTIDRLLAEPSELLTTTRSSAGPSPTPAAPTVPGYELLEPLGEGGMGIVWKGRQTKLNRLVALKMVLGGQHAGSRELIRFLAEAEAVAAIRHPHVVQVFDYGEAGGRPFLAMEYLSGGSLTDRLKQTDRLDPKVAAELVAILAGAVQAAHDLGIVHRDLKPANVLFDERGQPKVTDFGLAKRAGGRDLTATQAVMGTPAYMAPEQARGDTKFVGPQADVYSLGVILYQCLTGTRPFADSDPIALLRKVAEEEPERPGKRVRRLPRDVELICLKCLAKEPAERYPTAGALAADLGRFVAGEPVGVRAAGVVERAAKWARRKPTLAAAYTLGLLAVLLGGLGGAAAWQWRAAAMATAGQTQARESAEKARDGERAARATAEGERATAERARDAAESAQREAVIARDGEKAARAVVERARDAAELARREAVIARDGEKKAREQLAAVEYGRTIEVAHQEWRENNVGATVALLESTQADFRGWEWRYLNRLCHSDLLTLKGHTGAVRSASFSPDGSRIVTASQDNTAKVWDAKTGGLVHTLTGHIRMVYWASFSPDGSRILTASGDATAKVWDAQSGAEILTRRFNTAIFSDCFSQDGARAVAACFDQTAKVWDTQTHQGILTLRGHTAPVLFASFSHDGSRIVTASRDQTAKVWDAQTGTAILTLKGHTAPVFSASFSPDGSRVVTASRDRMAKIWDAQTGTEIFTLKGDAGGVVSASASFSPDGSRILTTNGDQIAKVWDARTGAEMFTLRGHANSIFSASFSRDGSHIATASSDQTVKVWDAQPGRDVLDLKGHTGIVRSASFSPDGARVVTASNDQSAKVWDLETGTAVLTLKGHTAPVEFTSFSRDGSRIVTASGDRTAKVWDARTGDEILTLKGSTASVDPAMYNLASASFSPDGSRILTVLGDRTAKVWDARSGAQLLTPEGNNGQVQSASFSPDGSRILTTSATAKVWDARSGAELLTLRHTGNVQSASFSPDGSRIVTTIFFDPMASRERRFTGSDGRRMVQTMYFDPGSKVWDGQTGAELLTLKGHTDRVGLASFSPDGSRILTAGFDHTARVWDAQSGAEVFPLKGHTDRITSASFSPDGSRLLTGSLDSTVKLWDARSGAEVLTLRHSGAMRATGVSASFSPDGSRILTTRDTAKVWDARPTKP
jgi:WD40 repeat protein/tRNA A-37 threonylcarbamoyl transferase component Bud32